LDANLFHLGDVDNLFDDLDLRHLHRPLDHRLHSQNFLTDLLDSKQSVLWPVRSNQIGRWFYVHIDDPVDVTKLLDFNGLLLFQFAGPGDLNGLLMRQSTKDRMKNLITNLWLG